MRIRNLNPDLQSDHKKKNKILRYKVFCGGIRKNPKIVIFDQISWNIFLINIFFCMQQILALIRIRSPQTARLLRSGIPAMYCRNRYMLI